MSEIKNNALTAEMLSAPGLQEPEALRMAADEMEDFLQQFCKMENLLGKGSINQGFLFNQINRLLETAYIVEQRNKSSKGKF